MLMKQQRELVVEYGRQMSSAGLSTGTSGNLSIMDRDLGYLAISPSGMGYFDTQPEDVVVLDLTGAVVDGNRTPSSEWAMHTAFYEAKPHANAVVHTHSIYCTTFAVLGEPIRAVHYVLADAGAATVPCTAYETYGTPELARVAVETCGDSDAVLLGNHGLICCGRSIAAAFSLARNVEFVAQIQWRARAIGQPSVLTDEQMATVTRRFQSYGQNTQPQQPKA